MDFGLLNAARERLGFLDISQTIALNQEGNIVLDPFSTLISRGVRLGSGNVIYPSAILECDAPGILTIGDNNIFRSGTEIAALGGVISIGNGNQFGEGGFFAKANREGARIEIGNSGRYLSGATVVGKTVLGSGSQILGSITADNCELEAGEPYSHPDPDLRAAVLKGQGLARQIKLARGEVIQGNGRFAREDILRQTHFHPPAAKLEGA